MIRPLGFSRLVVILVCCLGLLLGACSSGSVAAIDFSYSPDTDVNTELYHHRPIHNPDGIGKFYMGREISDVMGHQGAAWLERPSRELEEQPTVAIEALQIQPTDVVADIGAGTGYFSFRISPLVPEGKVLAVDVQPEMLEIIQLIQQDEIQQDEIQQDEIQQDQQVSNIETILGEVDDPHLPPESVDLALLVDAYHEFEYPHEMMAGIVQGLKPGGRVALLEYRGENPLIPIKRLHKMTQQQVKKEMQAIGLIWEETKDILPQQHLMIFRKPIEAA